MAGELEGRVSIITGGGSGMGRATSLMFAREGAAVAIADVNDEGGEQTAAQIEDLGGNALFVHTDVSSEQDVVNAVAEAAAKFGRLDSVVAAAGISYANYVEGDDDTDPFLHPEEAGSSLNRPTEFWQKVIDVNLTGSHVLCARGCPPNGGKEGHGGTIVNFASTAAYNPSPDHDGLLRLQGRRGHADALLRRRIRPPRHPRQRRRPRSHRDAHAGAGAPGSRRS